MATQESVDVWTVVIVADDEDTARVYRMPSTSTVGELRKRYASDVGVDLDACLLHTLDGRRLSDEDELVRVGEFVPGSRLVNLKFENVFPVTVNFYPSSGEGKQIFVCPSESPEVLHSMIRYTFGLESNQHFRLRKESEDLAWYCPLGDQGVEEGSHLVVETLYEVSVTEQWSGNVELYLIYASEPCEMLLNDRHCGPQRLLCEGRAVDVSSDIAWALLPFGAPLQWSFDLSLHRTKVISVLSGGGITSHYVWPTSSARSLRLGTVDASPSLMFDGQPVPHRASLGSLHLPDEAFLHDRPACVQVRVSTKRIASVRVPRRGVVADVQEAVRSRVTVTNFALTHRGRALERDERIPVAVLEDGDVLEVCPTEEAQITVSLDHCFLWWTMTGKSLRFTELMREVSCICHVPQEDLMDTVLHCVGCGRRVCRSEEAFQTIPAPCCRVRSLKLEERKSVDAETQEEGRKMRRSVGVSPSTMGQGSQASVWGHEVACEANFRARDLADLLPIRVVLPGRSLLLSVRLGDTLGLVVDTLRRCRLLVGVRELRVGQARPITAEPNWRERSFEEIGVTPGTELTVVPVEATAVRVASFVPTRSAPVDERTLALPPRGSDWEEVRRLLEPSSPRGIDSSTVAMQWGSIYVRDGRARRSVQSFDEAVGGSAFLDEDDGTRDAAEARSHFLLDILTDGSGLAAAPRGVPYLRVHFDTDVFVVAHDGHLLPVDAAMCSDPRAVLFLRGLMLRAPGGDAASLMIELRDGYADVDSGQHFRDADQATASVRKEGQWRGVLALLRDGVALPKYKIPKGKIVRVFTRWGIEVALEEGRVVRREGPADLARSFWMTSREVSQFNRDVTREARQ